jgi:hypothetical protein
MTLPSMTRAAAASLEWLMPRIFTVHLAWQWPGHGGCRASGSNERNVARVHGQQARRAEVTTRGFGASILLSARAGSGNQPTGDTGDESTSLSHGRHRDVRGRVRWRLLCGTWAERGATSANGGAGSGGARDTGGATASVGAGGTGQVDAPLPTGGTTALPPGDASVPIKACEQGIAVHWVSPTGAAAWASCESKTPLLDAVACSIATANKSAAAGDTICLRGGSYATGIAPQNDGTEAARITFAAYAGEDARFSGAITGIKVTSRGYITVDSVSTDGARTFADLIGAHHIWILNSKLTNSSDTGGWPVGVRMYNDAHHNWLFGCTIGNSGYMTSDDDIGGVMNVGNWENATDSTARNLIENCDFYHGGHHIIEVASTEPYAPELSTSPDRRFVVVNYSWYLDRLPQTEAQALLYDARGTLLLRLPAGAISFDRTSALAMDCYGIGGGSRPQACALINLATATVTTLSEVSFGFVYE